MKKLLSVLLTVTLIFIFSSCLKENHSVRFKNDYSQAIHNVVAGNAQLGDVGAGGISGYKPINAGNFSISGTTTLGQLLSGSGSIKGKGTHKWTITLSSSGNISIALDK